MKVFLILTLCVLSFLASAQEPQIIGGYILDGKDSSEELDAAVVTDSKRLDKNLDGKERYANQIEDCIYFPVYVKSSYSRKNTDSPLTKWKYNAINSN